MASIGIFNLLKFLGYLPDIVVADELISMEVIPGFAMAQALGVFSAVIIHTTSFSRI